MDTTQANGMSGEAASDAADVIHELEEELNDMGVKPQAVEPSQAPSTPPAPAPSSVPSAPAPEPAAVIPPPTAPASAAAPSSVPSVPSKPEEKQEKPESMLPAIPTPAKPDTPEHHEVMGQLLTAAIQKGKREVPAEPDPLVAKPGALESWRVFKIMSEFVEGFELLGKYGLAASFFGSAREGFASRFYDDATALAGKLAKSGFAVITGGSAGIMEAANKGAFDAGGASVGLNIRLDDSQGMNKYLTDSMTFDHFFVRKVMLTFASEVYINFPGGFGTLDEFTEIVTLVQTHKIRRIPIVLYGREYWEPFTRIFEEKLDQAYHSIDHADLELYRIVDSVDEAYDYIMKATGAKDVR